MQGIYFAVMAYTLVVILPEKRVRRPLNGIEMYQRHDFLAICNTLASLFLE